MSSVARRPINTDAFSQQLRGRAVDLDQRRLLVTNLAGSQQEEDLTVPANCGGFGRVRHFKRGGEAGWPPNPLPIDPASAALGLEAGSVLTAQVFQNAACNWRCWYCFVDFELLSADPRRAAWLTADDLVRMYLAEPDRPPVLDLTGGQPDLVPEWVPWTMAALRDRGANGSVYLWSDDNLSNDYFWRFLTDAEIAEVAAYPLYGRVCCFKGFDAPSFAFNTGADPALFDRQFELFGRLLGAGLDLYAYVTLTTPVDAELGDGAIARFMDRLQRLDEHLPLRTVPLEIRVFSPVVARVRAEHERALELQRRAVEAWQREVEDRFDSAARTLPIHEVPIRSRQGL